jgi:hypothetical protein
LILKLEGNLNWAESAFLPWKLRGQTISRQAVFRGGCVRPYAAPFRVRLEHFQTEVHSHLGKSKRGGGQGCCSSKRRHEGAKGLHTFAFGIPSMRRGGKVTHLDACILHASEIGQSQQPQVLSRAIIIIFLALVPFVSFFFHATFFRLKGARTAHPQHPAQQQQQQPFDGLVSRHGVKPPCWRRCSLCRCRGRCSLHRSVGTRREGGRGVWVLIMQPSFFLPSPSFRPSSLPSQPSSLPSSKPLLSSFISIHHSPTTVIIRYHTPLTLHTHLCFQPTTVPMMSTRKATMFTRQSSLTLGRSPPPPPRRRIS